MAKIRDIAQACKSKNAGPFELTIDVVFDTREMYEKVRATFTKDGALAYIVKPFNQISFDYARRKLGRIFSEFSMPRNR